LQATDGGVISRLSMSVPACRYQHLKTLLVSQGGKVAFISCFSAAAFLNIPYLEAVLGSKIDESGLIEFTVSEGTARTFKNGRIIHLNELGLPHGAMVLIIGY